MANDKIGNSGNDLGVYIIFRLMTSRLCPLINCSWNKIVEIAHNRLGIDAQSQSIGILKGAN